MASRRETQQSDNTVDSWTSSLVFDMEENLQLEEKLNKEAETPQELLHRLLSTKSAVSTASSFAQSRQAAIGTRAAFREIGTGSIGKVFEQPGTPWAFKVLLIDRHTKLWNNYIIHIRIQESFDALGKTAGLVEVPRVCWFASKDSNFWLENLDLFPNESTFPQRPREVLCMERVFALPEKIRHALIDVFCNPVNAVKAKSEPKNKDCLVRVFLGRRRFGSLRPGGSMFFSLRNYKLHLDQIRELNLDAAEYAISMADALAVLHWHSKIDAMDIEFVLGSSPLDRNAARRSLSLEDVEKLPPGTSTYEQTTNVDQDYKKRTVSLWLLDFDACTTITMDDEGVRHAVEAFLQTEPYCPRPNSQDEYARDLWTMFSRRYVATGEKITTGAAWQSLPAKFIQGITDRLSNQSGQSEAIEKGPVPPRNNQGPAQPRGDQAGQQAFRSNAPERRGGRQQGRGPKSGGGRRGNRG
ncbi:hypothetical protein N7489_007128 [Penicillium chrysogenum]|uniref:uncharacterized protein n=1 Tax=Penicillium chrysogenum TaxID=5076 RepID=UPI0024DF1E7C|nr:uncharacterized protein N7489_007128 [Penicillium chrysogenum]KAJ5237037.1 hypothetical protein N7489_007128 [Penicillium chrysogenum]